MSAHQTYVVRCDNCGVLFVDTTYKLAAGVRVAAQAQGWRHVVIPRQVGASQHLDRCPRCP